MSSYRVGKGIRCTLCSYSLKTALRYFLIPWDILLLFLFPSVAVLFQRIWVIFSICMCCANSGMIRKSVLETFRKEARWRKVSREKRRKENTAWPRKQHSFQLKSRERNPEKGEGMPLVQGEGWEGRRPQAPSPRPLPSRCARTPQQQVWAFISC